MLQFYKKIKPHFLSDNFIWCFTLKFKHTQATNSITSITVPNTINPALNPDLNTDTQVTTCNNKTLTDNNSTLKLLLDKIRKQKEDVATKSSQIQHDISIDSSVSELSSAPSPNKTGELDAQQQQQQQTSLFTLTQEPDKNEENDDTLVTENDTTFSSELDSIPSRDNEKKLIKGIMMSSHNVSSLNEIASDRRLG